MKKILKIVVPVVVLAIAVPLSVWGVSRIQLKKEEAKFVSGSWEEINWSPEDSYDPDDEKLYHTIDVQRNEEFNVLFLSDIHYRNGGWYGQWSINHQNTKTDKDLKMLKEEADPDLIIVTGDLETGTLNDKNYEHFTELMDSFRVPWTVVFGNHDAEHRADKAALMNILQKSEMSVFRQGPTNLGIEKSEALDPTLYNEKTDKYAGGLGNTVINLRDKESGEIFYAFILMDTGDWQNMYGNMTAKNRLSIGMRPFSRVGVGLTNKQIEWYKWVIDGIAAYNKSMGCSDTEAVAKTAFVSHIGMKALDYAAILSQYENSYGGKYVSGGYDNNDLPFHTEAEWSRPADRPYIEYDSSNQEITADKELMSVVDNFGKSAVEKEGNEAIAQYWCLADNEKREPYINGENEDYPNPKHIKELIPIIDKGFEIHKKNDLFLSAVYEKASTDRMISGHNHCDGYEVYFDGITYTSVVKTGDIYVDKECDMNNHGGSKFVITYNGDSVSVESTALYTKKENYKSQRYVRPVEEW